VTSPFGFFLVADIFERLWSGDNRQLLIKIVLLKIYFTVMSEE
jgi:hypothetical protein